MTSFDRLACFIDFTPSVRGRAVFLTEQVVQLLLIIAHADECLITSKYVSARITTWTCLYFETSHSCLVPVLLSFSPSWEAQTLDFFQSGMKKRARLPEP